jgi:hypothetical protein
MEPDLPAHDADPQVEGRLAVREERAAFLVVRERDPYDWLVRFDLEKVFPARKWAENMVQVFNGGLLSRSAGPPTPPGTRPAIYHPDSER